MAGNLLKYNCLLIILVTGSIIAQHKTELFLQDFGNDQLKKTVEEHVSAFLSELNSACADGHVPEFDKQFVKEISPVIH